MPKRLRSLYASEALVESGKLGREFVIVLTKYGKGLRAARDIERGEIITAYGGELLHSFDINDLPRTHMLRVPNSDFIWDGYSVSRSLNYDRMTGLFTPGLSKGSGLGSASLSASASVSASASGPLGPLGPPLGPLGYGAIANSSLRGNASIKWYYNDIDGRLDSRVRGYEGRELLPMVPFLVANKTILKESEIVWKYQVEIDPEETEIDE